MSQAVNVFYFRSVTIKVSVPHLQNFLNVPTTFELLFRLSKNFLVKKLNVLRQNYDGKVFSPNRPRDVQNICLICCVSYTTDWEKFEYWWEKFE